MPRRIVREVIGRSFASVLVGVMSRRSLRGPPALQPFRNGVSTKEPSGPRGYAFGVNVEHFPQGHDKYPEHDHSNDGQEEVYYVISGQATLTIDGTPHQMRAG